MKSNISYVRKQDAPILPPPINQVGIIGWLWRNGISSMTNFSSITNSVQSLAMIAISFIILYLGITGIWTLIDFAFIQAIWSDEDELKRLACATTLQGGSLPEEWFGACWPYIGAKAKLLVYGMYDIEEIWRVNITYLILFLGISWIVIGGLPFKFQVGIFLLTVYPILAFILLTGGGLDIEYSTLILLLIFSFCSSLLCFLASKGFLGEVIFSLYSILNTVRYLLIYLTVVTIIFSLDLGLVTVETEKWGGLLVTLVVAITGIVASLPLGVLLALGRRSSMPAIRVLCVVFIEFWRGVPLITVLFMASFMLPLFLPEGSDVNKLLRALIGVTLFSSAYMAEVIRGGLQAIPTGQYEASSALGLSYYQTSRLIVLPQALVLVIPGIVNTFIGLFKDTTLVLIISLFDLLGMIQSTFADPTWSTPVQSLTGYLAVACMFWVILFSMSRYSMFMEKKLRYEH
jgi:general L-amino acid transport system permease protein